MSKKCKNCRWWKERASGTGYERTVLKLTYRWCKRFPRPERKAHDDYCGEFEKENKK